MALAAESVSKCFPVRLTNMFEKSILPKTALMSGMMTSSTNEVITFAKGNPQNNANGHVENAPLQGKLLELAQTALPDFCQWSRVAGVLAKLPNPT